MNYAKVNMFDVANGLGIRVTLYVSGCKFHCPDCFNRETWDYTFGKPYTSQTESMILNRLNNDNFAGLTIIGGDPLWQSDEDIQSLIELCDKVHVLNKNVWIWSGYTWEELVELNDIKLELVKHTDVFVDGRFEKKLKDLSLAWRGSSNQRVIDVVNTLKQKKVILYGESNI